MTLDNLEHISIKNQVTDFPKHFHETFCISVDLIKHLVNGKYLLNKSALGELVKVNRFLAPEQDEDSMQLYNRDEI